MKLILYGDPVAKGRPRVVRSPSGNPITYTPPATVTAEHALKVAFLSFPIVPLPRGTPLHLTLRFYICRPQNLSKKVVEPVTRPDLDNLAKLVTDALEGLAYHTDSAFVSMDLRKQYAEYPDPPRTEIEITPLEVA